MYACTGKVVYYIFSVLGLLGKGTQGSIEAYLISSGDLGRTYFMDDPIMKKEDLRDIHHAFSEKKAIAAHHGNIGNQYRKNRQLCIFSQNARWIFIRFRDINTTTFIFNSSCNRLPNLRRVDSVISWWHYVVELRKKFSA